MALRIETDIVLKAFHEHPETFAAVRPDIEKAVHSALQKQIKHKSTDLKIAREISIYTGQRSFGTILDSFAPKEVSAFLKKLDPYNPALAGSEPSATRSALDNLIDGRAEPSAKPEKVAKAPAKKATAPASPKPKIGDLLDSKVHAGGKTTRSRAKRAS